jgi:hypothetical protein
MEGGHDGAGGYNRGMEGSGHYEGLDLTPPEEGFELYRHKNAEGLGIRGWTGLYWARGAKGGGFEIRGVLRKGEAYSYPGGVFPGATFERFYERVDPGELTEEGKGS